MRWLLGGGGLVGAIALIIVGPYMAWPNETKCCFAEPKPEVVNWGPFNLYDPAAVQNPYLVSSINPAEDKETFIICNDSNLGIDIFIKDTSNSNFTRRKSDGTIGNQPIGDNNCSSKIEAHRLQVLPAHSLGPERGTTIQGYYTRYPKCSCIYRIIWEKIKRSISAA